MILRRRLRAAVLSLPPRFEAFRGLFRVDEADEDDREEADADADVVDDGAVGFVGVPRVSSPNTSTRHSCLLVDCCSHSDKENHSSQQNIRAAPPGKYRTQQ